MFIRSGLLVALAAACQGQSAPKSVVPPAEVVATINGRVHARVVGSRPCRAMVDNVELMVGLDPLIAQVGATTWTGQVGSNGTTFHRGDAEVARLTSIAPLQGLALVGPDGITIMRVETSGDDASIIGGDGAVRRKAKREAQSIVIGDAVVTGTQDLGLAALIAAQDVDPEVRGLAACQHLIAQSKAL
ncbi:MAG: hypothetical protein AB7O24_14805 [Kofleriaceae bacterium]